MLQYLKFSEGVYVRNTVCVCVWGGGTNNILGIILGRKDSKMNKPKPSVSKKIRIL